MRSTPTPLTVAELIAMLQSVDPALPVYAEGCDCLGAVSRLILAEASSYPNNPVPAVIIGRAEHDPRTDWADESTDRHGLYPGNVFTELPPAPRHPDLEQP